MRIRTIVTLGFVFALSVGMGLAKKPQLQSVEKPVHWSVTGTVTFLGRDMETGETEGFMGICGGNGTFGRHTCSTFVRTQFVNFDTALCPDAAEYRFDVYSHVQRFRNGDLLYQQVKPDGVNYMCADPFVEHRYWGTITTEFVGGTGRFESATGEVEWEIVQGDFLEYDPVTGSGSFSGIVTELAGHIQFKTD